MATRTQSDPVSLTPVADHAPRRRRSEFSRRREAWRKADTAIMERLFTHPTNAEYHHASTLSRAKTDASYNPIWKVRRLFKELALRGDWQGFELLHLHLELVSSQVRCAAPKASDVMELIPASHGEMLEALHAEMEAVRDGEVDERERKRLSRELKEVVAAARPLIRLLDDGKMDS